MIQNYLQFRLLTEVQVRSLVNYRQFSDHWLTFLNYGRFPVGVVDIKNTALCDFAKHLPKMFDDMQGLLKGESIRFAALYRNMEKAKGFKTEPGQASPAFLNNPDKWFMRYDYQYKISFNMAYWVKRSGRTYSSGRHKTGLISIHSILSQEQGRIDTLPGRLLQSIWDKDLLNGRLFIWKRGDLTGIKRQPI